MTPALNEIESMVLKAARGAGLTWGLAEEMAQAARFLADHGFDWAAPVVDCLAEVDRQRGEVPPPIECDGTWIPAGTEPLSPALCGPLLSDLAGTITIDKPLRFGRMAEPLLLLPFAGRSAERLHCQFRLAWPGADFTCSGSGLWCAPEIDLPTEVEKVVFSLDEAAIPATRRIDRGLERQPIADHLRRQLEAWVHRTYVPASLESRLAGAGAGLTDND